MIDELANPLIQKHHLRAFLCHSSGDKAAVRDLYDRLKADGFDPWLDEESLLPGQDWALEIPKAVRASHVVIVCLSKSSITKEGFVQKEIKYAMDVADEKPEGTIFIIPLRLEDCDAPERLGRWHRVDLFDKRGYEKLRLALIARANIQDEQVLGKAGLLKLRIPTQKDISISSASLRKSLFEILERKHTESHWILATPSSYKKGRTDAYEHSQAISAIFSTPDASIEELRCFLECLLAPFDSSVPANVLAPFAPGVPIEEKGVKYGWNTISGDPNIPKAPSALYVAISLAESLVQPKDLIDDNLRSVLERQLFYTQEVLKNYYCSETGGWNMYAAQVEPSKNNTYTTALALLALLESRKAGLAWAGSMELREHLLRSTAQWLVDGFNEKADVPGWGLFPNRIDEDLPIDVIINRDREEGSFSLDALTLQVFAILLRAESEAAFPIPSTILQQVPRHIEQCAGRDLSYANSPGRFDIAVYREGKVYDPAPPETVLFLWYPWAINCSVQWLQRLERTGESTEFCHQARCILGHLVFDLGEDFIKKYCSDYTFYISEALFALASIPPA